MIGDKISDIIAAQSAGIKKFLVNNEDNDTFNFNNKNYTKKRSVRLC